MSISVYDMRLLVSQVYKSDTWKNKVQRMPDRQIMAIYYSFCERGEFDKKTKQPEKVIFNKIKIEPVKYSCEQIWMNI